MAAPRELLTRLVPGDRIRVAVGRSPNGIDHVVRMWRMRQDREGLRFEEMR